jgi:hypothetical protein
MPTTQAQKVLKKCKPSSAPKNGAKKNLNMLRAVTENKSASVSIIFLLYKIEQILNLPNKYKIKKQLVPKIRGAF